MMQRPPFYINRPRREALDPVTHANLGLKGHVEWQVREADGTIATSGERDNLILDQGLNMLPDRWIADCFTSCCVGTGNSAPAAGQTGLDLEIARTNTYQTAAGRCGTTLVDPVTWQMKRTFSFPVGALDSSRDGNYQEIGVSYDNAPGQNLFARTLFSSADAPAALAITATQSLWVVYMLTITCSPAAVTAGSIDTTGIGATPFTHAIQDLRKGTPSAIDPVGFAAVTGNGGTIAFNTAQGFGFMSPQLEPAAANIAPTGYYADKFPVLITASDSTNALDAPGIPSESEPANFFQASPHTDGYVLGNFYQDRHIIYAANQANFSISRLHFGYEKMNDNYYIYQSFAYALRFDSPIVKANTHTFEMVFRLSWGRA